MKVFCLTCDKYLHAIKGFAHFFNKYWSDTQPVIVCGFSAPEFDLPDNFTFFSIGKEEDYPLKKWSDSLIRVLESFPYDKHFTLMLEDYWLCQPVRQDVVRTLYDYMVQFDYVLKMDLCADRRYSAGVEEYPPVGDTQLLKSDFRSPYHMSLYTGMWNRKNMLRVLVPNENPWDVEIIGTPRLAGFKDEMLVLGTKLDPWPVKHILAFRSGNPDKLLTEGLSDSDVEKVRELGYKF